VRYVLLDARPWWRGGHALADIGKVRAVRRTDRAVSVDLIREQLRHGPPFTTPPGP
jgi:hypothetical protein